MWSKGFKDNVYQQIQNEKTATGPKGEFNFRFDFASTNLSLNCSITK